MVTIIVQELDVGYSFRWITDIDDRKINKMRNKLATNDNKLKIKNKIQ